MLCATDAARAAPVRGIVGRLLLCPFVQCAVCALALRGLVHPPRSLAGPPASNWRALLAAYKAEASADADADAGAAPPCKRADYAAENDESDAASASGAVEFEAVYGAGALKHGDTLGVFCAVQVYDGAGGAGEKAGGAVESFKKSGVKPLKSVQMSDKQHAEHVKRFRDEPKWRTYNRASDDSAGYDYNAAWFAQHRLQAEKAAEPVFVQVEFETVQCAGSGEQYAVVMGEYAKHDDSKWRADETADPIAVYAANDPFAAAFDKFAVLHQTPGPYKAAAPKRKRDADSTKPALLGGTLVSRAAGWAAAPLFGRSVESCDGGRADVCYYNKHRRLAPGDSAFERDSAFAREAALKRAASRASAAREASRDYHACNHAYEPYNTYDASTDSESEACGCESDDLEVELAYQAEEAYKAEEAQHYRDAMQALSDPRKGVESDDDAKHAQLSDGSRRGVESDEGDSRIESDDCDSRTGVESDDGRASDGCESSAKPRLTGWILRVASFPDVLQKSELVVKHEDSAVPDVLVKAGDCAPEFELCPVRGEASRIWTRSSRIWTRSLTPSCPCSAL
ncbi:hypothetical protein M885DRAFT_500699 [Pelagophyceae sp. CCMP2097]|nr:hypothetical protein M885DRAFT_500699 [Pelagophyceae sp. CCMP2097]